MSEGKYDIHFEGAVERSQFVIGDYNRVGQMAGLSADEVERLRGVFADLRREVTEQVPPEQREEALAQAGELEAAVVSEQPDPSRAKRVLRWFRDHAPQAAGLVVSVVVNPIVGKVVEAAGEVVADQFRDAVSD